MLTKESLSAYTIQETSGHENNCAFNAFFLALIQPRILDSISQRLQKQTVATNREFKTFLTQFLREAERIRLIPENSTNDLPEAWAAFREVVKSRGLVELQREFAPILRGLASQQAKSDPTHLPRIESALTATFHIYLYKHCGIPLKISRGSEDDIFIHHKYVMDKFLAMSQKFKSDHQGLVDANNKKKLEEALEASMAELLKWWETKDPSTNVSPYEQFLTNMETEGFQAGCVELQQLARGFGVSLYRWNKEQDSEPFAIHCANSGVVIAKKVYEADKPTFIQMRTRGIINDPRLVGDDVQITFLPLTKEQMEARVKEIPDYEKVSSYLKTHAKPRKDLSWSLTNQKIPTRWSEECKQELVNRNVITPRGTFEPVESSEEALKRIAKIEHDEKVLKAWEKYYHNPETIILHHKTCHWSNMLPPAVATTKVDLSKVSKLYADTRLCLLSPPVKPKAKSASARAMENETVASDEDKNDASIEKFSYDKWWSDDKTPLKVSKKFQIELDRELAEDLQRQEFKMK